MSEQRCESCGKNDEPYNGACRWCEHPFGDAVNVSITANPINEVVTTVTPVIIMPELDPQIDGKPVKQTTAKKPASKKK